jgi:hypothetical protein
MDIENLPRAQTTMDVIWDQFGIRLVSVVVLRRGGGSGSRGCGVDEVEQSYFGKFFDQRTRFPSHVVHVLRCNLCRTSPAYDLATPSPPLPRQHLQSQMHRPPPQQRTTLETANELDHTKRAQTKIDVVCALAKFFYMFLLCFFQLTNSFHYF